MRLAVADADALIAIVHDRDYNHKKALAINDKLSHGGVIIVFPNTAIIEAMTTLKRALNLPDKSELVNKKYQQGAFEIEYVNESIQMLSSKIYEKARSKKNTAFDAIVAACAEKLGAESIFSFDSWYTKLGFSLAG